MCTGGSKYESLLCATETCDCVFEEYLRRVQQATQGRDHPYARLRCRSEHRQGVGRVWALCPRSYGITVVGGWWAICLGVLSNTPFRSGNDHRRALCSASFETRSPMRVCSLSTQGGGARVGAVFGAPRVRCWRGIDPPRSGWATYPGGHRCPARRSRTLSLAVRPDDSGNRSVGFAG